MKRIKVIAMICMLLLTIFALTACGNRALIDTTYKFEYATVYAPDGKVVAEGKVTNWTDFDDGDQIQVSIDGTTYLTHSSLVILTHQVH